MVTFWSRKTLQASKKSLFDVIPYGNILGQKNLFKLAKSRFLM